MTNTVPLGAPVVEVDSRRRVSLSKTERSYDRYFLTEQPDGTIVLTPAIVITPVEARVLENPALVRRIQEAKPDDEGWIDVDLDELP